MTTPTVAVRGPEERASFLLSFKDLYISERFRKTYTNIDDLIVSLHDNGQIEPIVVRVPRPEDGTDLPWALVAGGRRCMAMLQMGWTQARAENMGVLSEWKQRVIELEENIQREAMTWQEENAAVAEISRLYKHEKPGWNDTQTAKLLKVDRSQVSIKLKLARAIEEDPSLLLATSEKSARRIMDTKRSLKASAARTNTVDYETIDHAVRCEDARDFLRTLEDNSVDLFLSDLPFGIDYFEMPASDRKAGGGASKFDDSLAIASKLVRDIFVLLAQKVKPEGWICVMISEDLRRYVLNEIVSINTQKYAPGKKLSTSQLPWIWYRPNSRSNPIDNHLNAKSMYDLIIPINAGSAVLRRPCENVIVIDSVYDDRVHAHQKPIPLGIELISRFTLPGDMVVDVTMGSGAFIAAAAGTHRRFAGCDNNPEMLSLARALVAQHFTNSKAGEATTPIEETEMPATVLPFTMAEMDDDESIPTDLDLDLDEDEDDDDLVSEDDDEDLDDDGLEDDEEEDEDETSDEDEEDDDDDDAEDEEDDDALFMPRDDSEDDDE